MRYCKLVLFFLLALALNTAIANPFGKFSKKNLLKSGDTAIHRTNFVAKSDFVSTNMTMALGNWKNNRCEAQAWYSADVDIDPYTTFDIYADDLQDLNGQVTCIMEKYQNNKTGKSSSISYQLLWNGKNYTSALPSEHTVMLE